MQHMAKADALKKLMIDEGLASKYIDTKLLVRGKVKQLDRRLVREMNRIIRSRSDINIQKPIKITDVQKFRSDYQFTIVYNSTYAETKKKARTVAKLKRAKVSKEEQMSLDELEDSKDKLGLRDLMDRLKEILPLVNQGGAVVSPDRKTVVVRKGGTYYIGDVALVASL